MSFPPGATDAASVRVRALKPKRRGPKPETIEGLVFATPALLGLVIFTIGPVLVSLAMSFADYNIIKPPTFIGLGNYITALTDDELFWQSLRVTVFYTVVTVPLNLFAGFMVAVMMNQKVRGISLYRTLWYMPSIVPVVANAVLWQWIFNPDFGLLNLILGWFGIPGPRWFVKPDTAIPAFIIMALWGMGGSMLIYLGGLQGIPEHLYEAVEIDGGNWWARFRHVTVPMMTPTIFFNLIMGLINTFQVFTPAFVMTQGGPAYATYFYVLHLYKNAFQYLRMGYSSALAWILMLIVLTFTLVLFRSSGWVYYEGAEASR
ncbi:MAG: carbohydrate ABC transporter permease [Anaerolineae bacterium]